MQDSYLSDPLFQSSRVAVLTEWLTVYGGAERVLEQVLSLFPNSTLFSLIDFLASDARGFVLGKRAQTSFIQHLPFVRSSYRYYLPLMPVAIERFDFSNYDLIISCSHAVTKGILTTPNQLHISYLQARNLKYAYESRSLYGGKGLGGLLQDALLTRLRVWDSVASQRPDVVVANSRYVANWHQHRHKVASTVIYPPVNVELFAQHFTTDKDDYYVVASRLEPYKRVDVVIEAFNHLAKPLLVLGDGTQLSQLKAMAKPNITFLGYCDTATVAKHMAKAKAFVFASEEDFGIAPLEAQACGTPVIAYGRGGVAETVRPLGQEKPTGILFAQQTAEALQRAVLHFEENSGAFLANDIRAHSLQFNQEHFRHTFASFIQQQWQAFQKSR